MAGQGAVICKPMLGLGGVCGWCLIWEVCTALREVRAGYLSARGQRWAGPCPGPIWHWAPSPAPSCAEPMLAETWPEGDKRDPRCFAAGVGAQKEAHTTSQSVADWPQIGHRLATGNPGEVGLAVPVGSQHVTRHTPRRCQAADCILSRGHPNECSAVFVFVSTRQIRACADRR